MRGNETRLSGVFLVVSVVAAGALEACSRSEASSPSPPEASARVAGAIRDGAQANSRLAVLGDGRLAVVYTDASSREFQGDVRVQLYSKDGRPEGRDFVAHHDRKRAQLAPAAAALSDGGLVVTWQDGSNGGWQIKARRFDGRGGPLDDEDILVSPKGIGEDTRPRVAGLKDGGFVIAWERTQAGLPYKEVWVQRHGLDGRPLSTATAAFAAGLQPDVTALPSGGYAVAWLSQDRALGPVFVNVRSILPSREALSDKDTAASTVPSPRFQNPAIVALGTGDLLVVWEGDDADGCGIQARWLDSMGHARWPKEQLINSTMAGAQIEPAVTATAIDVATVVWTDAARPGQWTLRGRQISAGGPKDQGDSLLQGGSALSRQPAVAFHPMRGLVVAWTQAEDAASQASPGADVLIRAFGRWHP